MTSAAAARRIAAAPAAARPPFPDELLEEIFVRLDDAADLARASAACASFRRVVSARPFLRRFKSLDAQGFHPAEPPHRDTEAGRALALAADFTFSFLPPGPRRWGFRNARDGVVLLSRRTTAAAFDDLVVCDPLNRRYVRVPDDLAASVPQRDWNRSIPFLAPAVDDDDDGKEERWPPFSVVCAVESQNKAVAFVFFSGNGKWRGITYHCSSSLPAGMFCRYQRSYAHGCCFWIVDSASNTYALVLDTLAMKFTTTDDLPLRPKNGWKHAIVEAGEGMLGLMALDEDNSTIRLSRRVWRNHGGVGGGEWQPYKTIPLPKEISIGKDYHHRYWFTAGATESYLLLMTEFDEFPIPSSNMYQTLDLKTLLLERLCVSKRVVTFMQGFRRCWHRQVCKNGYEYCLKRHILGTGGSICMDEDHIVICMCCFESF